MQDMGHKEEGPTIATEGKSKKVKISYPGFSIKGDNIPGELNKAENGTLHRIEIIVRKTGDNIDTYVEGEPHRVEMEVHKLGYIGKAGKLSREEYLGKSEEDRAKYDQEQLEGEPEEKTEDKEE